MPNTVDFAVHRRWIVANGWSELSGWAQPVPWHLTFMSWGAA